MECYLKNLLDEKAESNSAEVRIIDDNFNSSSRIIDDSFNNSSLSSLTDPWKLGNSRSSSRWADSSNSMDFEDSSTCLDYQDPDTSSYMSARMERHRRNRWNASANSSMSSRHSLSPGVLRHRKRRSAVPNSKTLDGSLDLETPSLAGRQRPRKPVKQARDYKDDHGFHNHTRLSPTLSPRLFDIDASMTHQMVIDEAIAISTDESMCTTSETSMRRVKRGDSSKHESKCAPPSVPVRRRSIEHSSYDSTHMDVEEDRKLEIPPPPPPARKVSLDSFDSHHSTDLKGKPNLEIPNLIGDVPHRQHNRRRRCRKHPSM